MCTKLYTNSKDKSLHFLSNQHFHQNFERIQSILNGEENVTKVLINKNNSDDENINYNYDFFISKFEKRPLLHTFRSHINQWIKEDLKSE